MKLLTNKFKSGGLHEKHVMSPGVNPLAVNNNNNNNVECKNKGDTSNNRGDWDYFKVVQKIREQHTGKT